MLIYFIVIKTFENMKITFTGIRSCFRNKLISPITKIDDIDDDIIAHDSCPWLACLSLYPRFAGSKPDESDGYI
jgi:hypothetical protein